MAQAALTAGLHPLEFSFKHTVQLWSEWTIQRLGGQTAACRAGLFALIAQRRVRQLPERIERHARKCRSKSYPWLKLLRHLARQQMRPHAQLRNA